MKNTGINIADWSISLTENKAFYMAVIDAGANLTFVNSHFFKSFQLTPAAAKNSTFFDCMYQDDLDRFRISLEKSLTNGASAMTELRMKNDQCKWVKWQISCMENAGAGGTKFLCLGYDIAGEEQLEKYARIAGQNYRKIMEDLSVGIIFQDNDGCIISANGKASAILETTLENFYTNKNILCLWKTADLENAPVLLEDTPFMKALQTGENQINVVVSMVTPEGNDRTILWNSQPLCEIDQSVPSFVVSTLVDITKEKKLEKEVKTREALFTSFMDHTPCFTWMVDKEGNLLYANQTLLDHFEVDKNSIGRKISAVLSPSLADAFYKKIDQVFRRQQPEHSIVKSFMADGTEQVFQLTIFPIHGIHPSLIIGGEALDITESYNAREEAKKANERLFYISQASSEAIWDWNMATGQIYCNQALQDMMGSKLNNVLDLGWCFQCIHEDDRVRVEKIILDTIEKQQQSWQAEYRFLTMDGSFKNVYHRGFILYDGPKTVRMIGSIRDISEVKKLENQLVTQRLKQQKSLAESIIHAHQEERARIGHELHDNINQILTSAHLYMSLLDRNSDEFGEIKAKAQEIINLAIEEIRILSKEMVMPDFKEEGLIGSIGHLADDLRYTTPFKVEFTHNDKWSIELLDMNKKITLFRIIQEQTKNILKYSKAKKIKISLNATDDQIRLLICDDGQGFDATNTRRGLGLSNIFERTRLYGGKVILNTAPGKGCTLIVNIPVDARISNDLI